MVWHKVKTWSDDAFIKQAMPELTRILGLHLVLNDLDDAHLADADLSLVNPLAIEDLHATWVARALTFFPTDWHRAIRERVASAEYFHLALISHLDQVRFAIKVPNWIRALRILAIVLAVTTALAVLAVFGSPFGPEYHRAFLILGELAPLGAATCGIISALALDKFRMNRSLAVSDAVRRELTGAINHAFVRPINEVTAEMTVFKQLSLDEA